MLGASLAAGDVLPVTGVVRDSQSRVVTGAEVSLLTAQQAVVETVRTDAEGRFAFAPVPPGSYLVVVAAPGFAPQRLALALRPGELHPIEVTLSPEPVRTEVTVTANPGQAEETQLVPQPVNVIGREEIQERAKAVVAQAVAEEAGVYLQRTSPSLAGVFVRGLTGNKVNVYVDGVRYSTAAARGGINTFLSLVEPTQLEAIEILRGPNSALYGSDALGGSVEFLTAAPALATNGPVVQGAWGTSFNSADLSYGSDFESSFATRRLWLFTNLAGRRINTLRPGEGFDSHAAVTRFLGLSSDVLGHSRLPDTAFTQYSGLLKLQWVLSPGRTLTVHYSRSQQDGGKRYDQLLGGDGNLIADLRNLMLDFFYARYESLRLGWLDHFSAAYSFNAQREERVNQGGQGDPQASINHEYERTGAHGLQAQAGKQWRTNHTFLLGGEFYHERIRAPSFSFDPVTDTVSLRRPRVPDHARYRSGGAYIQDIFEAVPQKLQLVGSLRYSGAAYRARALDSPLVSGERLWPDDSLTVSDLSFRAGAVVFPLEGLSVAANLGRGFRAPHMTDLGTLGLTGSGFEVAAPDVAGLGATVGSTADSSAVSLGRPVIQVKPEHNLTYEAALRYQNRRLQTNFSFFVNDLSDTITKQALILPLGAVGTLLGAQPVIAQNANGVVFVAVSPNPVLLRANFGDVRLRGFEHSLRLELAPAWSVETVFTAVRAWDKSSRLPPNIEGGTPPADAYFKLRYAPAKWRLWLEPYVHVAGRQTRLSTLDLEDRRTGATRTRGSIASFFAHGATVLGLVEAGPDTTFGTADDVLAPTGETLAEVQDRVLGLGVDSAPLFTAVPGYLTVNLRGGFSLRERHDFLFEFENLGDRNYRGISWGMNGAGRSFSFRYLTRF